jgi:cell fate (sporulation/competence/biofilm development) regulator YmcA (YheA/YmcA/DUF963 family)
MRAFNCILICSLYLSTTLCLHCVAGETPATTESTEENSVINKAARSHFDKVVAPLLAARCLTCHSGANAEGSLDLRSQETAFAGGASGKAILPGSAAKSLLYRRVHNDEMPPEHPLPKVEKEILKAWIAAGAVWGSGPIDPFQFTTETRAGYDWWSLQPVKNPPLPKVKQTDWPKNGIDYFILAKLEEKGLEPSAAASPRSLVRRLHFDLIGLPPEPDVIEQFAADPTEAAYADMVDQLLASPRYGERWSRHWLDVARYGESDGFERNNPRKNAWPYRDWVINALNADMPYDRFAQMQIAGDILQGDGQGAAAVGFLTAGVHNTVVGASERMKKLARQDELEEIVGAVAQGFLGLTIHCARCHDHKFDPVLTEEYYRFIAALDGVHHGQRSVSFVDNKPELAKLNAEIDALQKELGELQNIGKEKVLAERQTQKKDVQPAMPQAFATWEFEEDAKDTLGKLHGTLQGNAHIANGALVLDGNSYVTTAGLESSIGEKTLEAWILLDDLTQRGGGVMSIQTTDGSIFDGIVYGEREPQRWMAGSNFFRRTQSFSAPAETTANKEPVHIALVYQADGTVTAYRNGQPYGKSYKTGTATFKAGTQIAFGMRHSPAGANKMLKGKILRANFYNQALDPEAIAASAGIESDYVSSRAILSVLSPAQQVSYRKADQQLAGLLARRSHLQTQKQLNIYTVVPRNPGPMQVHVRGSVTDFGKVVTPGGVQSLGAGADFGLTANASDADRRKQLAEWITSSTNPLFGRVIANRLWHHHFGQGLVQTPSDLGFGGGLPSHPELLDWLAIELEKNDYKLKSLHRLMVLSATYRQASAPRNTALTVDRSNRLLWRFSPARVDAEVLRDAMLMVAGSLNPQQGGPGFEDVSITSNNGTVYYEPIARSGTAFDRRTVYRFSPRGGRSALLDTFDCPDPSTATPRRNITTTPLQALSLLNNEFVLRMADRFAERVTTEVGNDTEKQVRQVWQLALGRLPSDAEQKLSAQLVAKHGLPALCRAMFNTNEFVVIQ